MTGGFFNIRLPRDVLLSRRVGTPVATGTGATVWSMSSFVLLLMLLSLVLEMISLHLLSLLILLSSLFIMMLLLLLMIMLLLMSL